MSDIIDRRRRRNKTAGNMRLDVLQEAVTTIVDACGIQVGLKLEPDGFPGSPGDLCKGLTLGSSIPLTTSGTGTGWTMALVAGEQSCRMLTRALFDMDPDEDVVLADMVDAMGEIPNVAAGTFKAIREKSGEHLQLGLPIFTRGHGHLKYLPFDAHAVAQTVIGDNDFEAQVVLIWRDSDESEGEPAQTDAAPAKAPKFAPEAVLDEAIASIVNTCEVQIEVPLQPSGEIVSPSSGDSTFGSSIALTTNAGGWNLAMLCDKSSAATLTRALFAMESGEETIMEDMADALSEIVNVAAGVMKSSRKEAGQEVRLGLPLFIEGDSCVELLANGVQGLAQTLTGPDGLEAQVVLIWQEGKQS